MCPTGKSTVTSNSTDRYRFDLFGTLVQVRRRGNAWQVSYLGTDGKHRPAHDIRIPADLPAPTLRDYLDDLCHERATLRHPRVLRL